eukprot:CAMPEP_0185599934 /NCGR_PEP_ID=MMETSP0434-20130131/83054_1 /TAXON_ID=626734 ORGANISM="Favella taraikaensis, Strain Fe Narragansett Bay" /NCGR_SAMPLE_ID=MMETSP0434 /ASSEMBLY_ACC=CAM_ASM_000379 /LENGTH=127 /DNA_ID=CAMNT_0028229535 /DNA_START=2043 /DNA_END=2426 /DNA_ORIENTATION=-
MLVKNDSRQRQSTHLVALNFLVETISLKVLREVLPQDHDLALGVMFTFYRHLGAFALFMLDKLPAWHAQLAQVALKEDELAIVLQVVLHAHAYHLLDTVLAYLDTAEALFAVAGHLLTSNPGLTPRV